MQVEQDGFYPIPLVRLVEGPDGNSLMEFHEAFLELEPTILTGSFILFAAVRLCGGIHTQTTNERPNR